jgi:hypothetical protein
MSTFSLAPAPIKWNACDSAFMESMVRLVFFIEFSGGKK